ncbi:hypothetical protein [Terricaulis sp.]|uniref:DMP19 family protein n=1 Tax=Terricaulis sp. TaxID=2768686 RepID=UPI00378334C3
MMDEVPPVPPPWIEQFQREHLAGDTALTTFQGLLTDELILPRGALDSKDPAALVNASIAFVNSMQNDALLLPGEFAQEALWGYFAQDYVNQAREGGHVQYFLNRGGDSLAVKLSGMGLKSMIADPHLALFNQFLRLRRADEKQAHRLAKEAGFRNVEAAIRGIDAQFQQIEQSEPLVPRHRTWLKSLRKLRVVPDADWRDAVMRIAHSNPLLQARRAEREHAHVEFLSSDPVAQTALELCAMAGLRFDGIGQGAVAPVRSVWPEGPNARAMAWRVDTDAGPRNLLMYVDGGFFKKRLAVLVEPGQALPAGSTALTRENFEAAAPGVI